MLARILQCQHTKGLDGKIKFCSQALLWNILIWVVAHETQGLLPRCHCLGRTFTYKVKDREIILSCLPFFQYNNYHLYLEIFDLFLKCADAISAHRTRVRMWSIINPSRRRAIGRRCTLGLCQAQQSLRDFAFVVVGKAPAYMAARLPVSEKDFVVDHAQSLGFNVGDPWRSHPEKGLRKC